LETFGGSPPKNLLFVIRRSCTVESALAYTDVFDEKREKKRERQRDRDRDIGPGAVYTADLANLNRAPETTIHRVCTQ
jgi:hypothetical protein